MNKNYEEITVMEEESITIRTSCDIFIKSMEIKE